jgi:hypothetical protein
MVESRRARCARCPKLVDLLFTLGFRRVFKNEEKLPQLPSLTLNGIGFFLFQLLVFGEFSVRLFLVPHALVSQSQAVVSLTVRWISRDGFLISADSSLGRETASRLMIDCGGTHCQTRNVSLAQHAQNYRRGLRSRTVAAHDVRGTCCIITNLPH